MALVVVVLLGIAALTGIAVLLGMSESPLSSEPVDRLDDGLPDRTLTSHDVGGLRFRIGLRGYRMDDVDQALDRLRDALREAEERSDLAEQTLATPVAAPGEAHPFQEGRDTQRSRGSLSAMAGRGPVRGEDGRPRCPWALSAPEYVSYHDTEWGRPLTSDDQMFERMSLEGFQSGLSWLVILRKRPAFRVAFADFSIPAVAGFREKDVSRLLADAGIVRNRAKIEATISNAEVVADLPGGLLAFVQGFAPTGRRRAPRTLEDLPAKTAESIALAKALRGHGVKFVGPTTAYALMQATGLVNDHLAGCVAR